MIMLPALPSGLPSVHNAKLPKMYEGAKEALAECSRIDECADWANKAEALASYAKQAGDESLRKTADRIQARAIRRCGELLKEIRPAKNQHEVKVRASGGAPTSRTQAAKDAGLSRDQRVAALRVASVPAADFEEAVESEVPPTVTELAARGTKRQLVDLEGRDPKEFAASTDAQGHIRRLADCAEKIKPAVVARGAFPAERKALKRQAKAITACEVLRDDFSTKEEDESQTSFPGEAFGGLQHAYLVHDGDERMVVPIEKMSAAQCWEKVAELEQMAKGCIRHSEAMRRWIGVTFPEQAAAQ